MDTNLTHSYLNIIQAAVEQNADLEKEVCHLKDQVRDLEERVRMLEEERRLYSRVYINEMHGTVEGDAYQRKTS